MAKFDLNDDTVVVVIGSGAGGGTLSNELAQKGINVVCLEAGKRLTLDDIENDWGTMFGKLSWTDKRIGTGALNPDLPLWVCKTVGGTTVHWAGAALRFQDHEWKAKSTYGDIPGANLLDWPVDANEMERFYSMAEDKMGVTGRQGIPQLPGNNNFKAMLAGAQRLGYTKVHTGNMAINSEPRGGRPSCQQIGFCMAGCKIGAKWSALYTEIPAAEATGHFELRPESMVLKINHDSSGKVTSVVYVDKEGNTHEQKARIIAVAGNSVETPRLLLNSASSMFPDGMANSSGQVGKNFMRHMTGTVYAILPQPVHFDRGTQMAGIVQDEAHHDDSRGFVAGYEMETLPGFGLAGVASNTIAGAWGREYAKDIEMYDHFAGMWLVGEDLPQEQNGVTLHDSQKDQYGMPVPVVHFEDHPNDTAMRNHAFKRGSAIYEAIGATKTFELPPFPSTHNMGTCRMSADAKDGVCNPTGQTHDIPNLYISDGSQFTTSAAENPTLTIVSLAIRQAEKIAERMNAGEI
ncbi:MAG: 2-keto-gluconate dehydrogenase [Rhodospirillaceae bacterium]|nr:2-keto-gluconate dehydrogenase [Rhodospirillaceae bacterium]